MTIAANGALSSSLLDCDHAIALTTIAIAQSRCRDTGTYNYFDPDNYISTSALLWSNDPFLQKQARAVVYLIISALAGPGAMNYCHGAGV